MGSDLDDIDHRHLRHHPRAVTGSEVQDSFGREQHEALVRSMNEQIRRQHDQEQQSSYNPMSFEKYRVDKEHDRLGFGLQNDKNASISRSRKDGRSLSNHKQWLETHRDN